MNEERLADDLDLLHSLHRLGDEQQVREQHAVHVHLREEVTHVSARTQSSPVEGPRGRRSVSQTYPAVLALLHPQRPLQVQLSDLLRRRSPHGSHQVEVVVILQDLMEGRRDRERERRLDLDVSTTGGLLFVQDDDDEDSDSFTFSTSSLLPSTASYESMRADTVASFCRSWRWRIRELTPLMKPSTMATWSREKHTKMYKMRSKIFYFKCKFIMTQTLLLEF